MVLTIGRYIETGERCVVESLKLLCSILVACTSENAHGSPVSPKPSSEHVCRLTDDTIVEKGAQFSTELALTMLARSHPLFGSCAMICQECRDNLPMQSALMQSINTICIYVLQENARLLHRKKTAAEALSKLKPIEKVCISIILHLGLFDKWLLRC